MLVKILAFLAIVQLAQSSSCAKGPSYWCQSVQTAKECGAYNHCLSSVWSKHETYTQKKIANPQECASCIQCLFSDARRCPQLMNFKKEISDLFENNITNESICHLIGQCQKTTAIQPAVTRCNSKNVCDNLAMSVKCSSFPKCLDQWKQLSYDFKKPTTQLALVEDSKMKTCGFCVYIFTEIEKVLQQNTTEIDVENYLKSGCKLCPNSEYSQNCIAQVDLYLPQIFNFLRDNLDPGVICHVIQMCDDKYLEPRIKMTTETPLEHKKQINLGSTELSTKMKSTGGMGCEICTIILDASRFLIKNEVDEKKIVQFIDKNLCHRLGSYNQTCSEYVEKEGASIIEILEDDIEPAMICGEIGLCINTQIKLQSQNPFDLRQKSPGTCSACKSAVDNAKDMIASHYSDMDVMESMNKELCQKMGDLKYLCKTTLDLYSQSIMAIMGQQIESVQVCEMLGTCSIETSKHIEEIAPEFIKDEKNANNCEVCRFAMKVLDQFIEKNSTAIEIKEGLEKVCRVAAPNKYKDQCVRLVETYTDTIIYLLTKQVPYDYICDIIGVCKQTTIDKFVTAFIKQNSMSFIGQVATDHNEKLQERIQKDQNPECVLCEFAITYLSKYIKKDSTEEELIAEFHHVCDMITGTSLKAECNTFIDTYGKQVIDVITKDLDPKETCQQIGVCPSKIYKNTNLIETLKSLTGYTNKYDWKKNLQETIDSLDREDWKKNLPYSVNGGIQYDWKKDFYKPVESTALPSVHLKKTDMNLIDLQPAKLINKSTKSPLKLFEEKKDKETIECTLCIYLAQLSDNFLKQNKTVSEIEDELKMVCMYFPNQLSAQCKSFIEEYGPYVVQLIATDLDPETVCGNLKLCGNPNPPSYFETGQAEKILSLAKRSTEYAYLMPEDFKLDYGNATIKNVKVKEISFKPLKNN